MPSESSLNVFVVTGLGISVVAGIVSGVCYVITHGFQKKRYRKPQTPWHCAICGSRFRSIDGILEVEKVAACSKCKTRVCRWKCSSRSPEHKWLCQACQESESWFKGILHILQPSSKREWYVQSKMEPEPLSELDEDLLELKKKEKQQVRDFIERLVGTMLGGNLDDVVITKLYDDANYDRLYGRYHCDLSAALTELGSALHISIANLPIHGQSPCTAHASLKQLIQRFVQEAAEIPPLKVRQQGGNENEFNRTYEDLLSTAIINKVIQNYQESRPSSSRSSVRNDPELKKTPEPKEYFFSKETLDNKWKSSDGMDDTSSISSTEDCIKSESSVSIKYYDDLSLTIQQRIEEVSSTDDEHEDEPNRNLSENWRLQKRQFTGTHSPVPVPMLVPNPTVEAKVLIGDREAEDTTDLSDAASDYGDIDSAPSVNAMLVESKTIIGGKNIIDQIGTQHQVSVSDEGSTDYQGLAEDSEDVLREFLGEGNRQSPVLETKNEVLVPDNLNEDPPTSLDSNFEQNLEHTERYATLPRQIEKLPEPKPRNLKGHAKELDKHEASDKGANEENNNNLHGDNESLSDGTIEGSYSQREKEKWQHAIHMDNNPYTKENLERRLSSRSNSSVGSTNVNMSKLADVLAQDIKPSPRHGRDYYIRQASNAAGASERLSSKLKEEDPSLTTTNSHENDDVDNYNDADADNYNEEENDGNHEAEVLVEKIEPLVRTMEPLPLRRIEQMEEMKIVRALPALITDSPSDLSSIETPISRPNNLEISSDSDLSIERSYNLQTGKITQKFGDLQREVLTGAKSPEGVKYSPITTELDENHNDSRLNHNVPFTSDTSTNLNGNLHDDVDSFSLNSSDYNSLIHYSNENDVEENAHENDLNGDVVDKEHIQSVGKLKKLFENKDTKKAELVDAKQSNVYSLTARSIPKHVTKELRNDVRKEPEESVVGESVAEEEEVLHLPSVKSVKQFFESLK